MQWDIIVKIQQKMHKLQTTTCIIKLNMYIPENLKYTNIQLSTYMQVNDCREKQEMIPLLRGFTRMKTMYTEQAKLG